MITTGPRCCPGPPEFFFLRMALLSPNLNPVDCLKAEKDATARKSSEKVAKGEDRIQAARSHML